MTFVDFNNLKSFDEVGSFLFGKGGRGKECGGGEEKEIRARRGSKVEKQGIFFNLRKFYFSEIKNNQFRLHKSSLCFTAVNITHHRSVD